MIRRSIQIGVFFSVVFLQGCNAQATPIVESSVQSLTTEQVAEMARQYVSMLPESQRNGVEIRIDGCWHSLASGFDQYGGKCDYFVSHVVDGHTWGARVHSTCNPDNVCIFKMEPYEIAK